LDICIFRDKTRLKYQITPLNMLSFLKPLAAFCTLTILSTTTFFAQTPQTVTAEEGMQIRRATSTVELDGVIDEDFWATADIATDFTVNFPVDTGMANARTEIRMAYDQKYLYVSAVCYQKQEEYTIQSLRRDFGPGTSDALNVLIGPFKDGLNGFLFSVNPYNVQREALIDNGGNLSYEWDNVWKSAVKNEPDKWTVEMAIPFKTLRYKVAQGTNSWDFNFLRTRLKPWEVSTWKRVPQQYPPNNLAFCGTVTWTDNPPNNGVGVSIIPYVSGRYSRTNVRNDELKITDRTNKFGGGVGGDVKIGVTPSLNLDLTINPDFSQVEVDRQVANVSRFQLFFPERRQFFLENRDLFSMFGFPNTRPFFSRQIGLADTSLDRSQTYAPVPILFGARLSGKLNDKWRIGLLNMQTRRLDISANNVIPAANFTVATAQRKLFKRSALSAILADKTQFLKQLDAAQQERYEPWNRVGGLEFNFFSEDNRWEAESFYHRSFSPDPDKRGASMAQFIGYDVRKYAIRAGFQRSDTSYTADIGFVPRPGVQGIFTGFDYRWYPAQPVFNTVSLSYNGDITTDLHSKVTDSDLNLGLNIGLKDQSSFTLGVYTIFTKLFEPFDPTNTDQTPLPSGNYRYNGVFGNYNSSTSYNLQGNIDLGVGQVYNGFGISANGDIKYRLQPYGIIGVSYSYNHFDLPKPYAQADLFLLGPSLEFAINRSLFASAFFQYNTQANNFNINARIQWRFAPVSDLFLVYTDNSYANRIEATPVRFLAPKNKALVLKVVYWLNV
jgi:hypothetical protein